MTKVTIGERWKQATAEQLMAANAVWDLFEEHNPLGEVAMCYAHGADLLEEWLDLMALNAEFGDGQYSFRLWLDGQMAIEVENAYCTKSVCSTRKAHAAIRKAWSILDLDFIIEQEAD